MGLIPHEVIARLEHSADALDEMNTKLDTLIEVLLDIKDLLKEQRQ